MKFKRFDYNFTETLFSLTLGIFQLFLLMTATKWLLIALGLPVINHYVVLFLSIAFLYKNALTVPPITDKDTVEQKLVKTTAHVLVGLLYFTIFYLFMFQF